MFGGYQRYLMTLTEAAPGWRPGSAYYSARLLIFTESRLQQFFGGVPKGAQEHLARVRREIDETGVPLICALRRADVEHYMPGAVLPKVDRMSMRHSLEVRTPYLNVELARFAERVPPWLLADDGRGKRLLRELAYRYLPREMVDAPKKGFGLPATRWARQEMLSACGSLLESQDSRLGAAMGGESIRRYMAQQRAAEQISTYELWTLATLESWLRQHPARMPVFAESAEIVAPAYSPRAASRKARIAQQYRRFGAIGAATYVAKGVWYQAKGRLRHVVRGPDRFSAETVQPFCRAVSSLADGSRGRRAQIAELNKGDRIVLVTHALPPGGAERQWCYLAQTLQRLGYQVSVCVSSPLHGENAHYLPMLRQVGIEPIDLSAPLPGANAARDWPGLPREMFSRRHNPLGPALPRLASVLRQLKPKVVLAQLDSPNLLAAIAGLIAGVPRVVMSFRNYNPTRFPVP